MAAPRPRPAHRVPGGRPFRRVVAAVEAADQGGSGGGSHASNFWVQEEDGTSKWLLEEGTGYWITEESA